MIPNDCEVVRKHDPPEQLIRHHSHGIPYVELEIGAWFRLDLSSGNLHAPFEGAEVRGDLSHTVLKSPALRERLRRQLFDWGVPRASKDVGLQCPHVACVSPEGLRNKLDIYRANFQILGLSAQQCTKRLIRCVSDGLANDSYHQFYAEEVQALLERGADPTATTGLPNEAASVLLGRAETGSSS